MLLQFRDRHAYILSLFLIASTALLWQGCAAAPDAAPGEEQHEVVVANAGESRKAPDAEQEGAREKPAEEGGEQSDLSFRRHRPRKLETIFSPLDLPAPNRIRTASGSPGPDYWQQRVDYVIEATLDAANRTVRGRETLTYTNNSPEALPFLWIQLEQNLFRKDSLGARMRAPGERFGNASAIDGGCELSWIRLAGKDLKIRIHDTLARVDLPAPVPPKGGTVVLEAAWSFRIPPQGSDRMGLEDLRQGTIFELAQWFPAVANFDDVHGWNTLPYLGQGEFYTNFGSFDVKLTVPRAHIVGATGVLQNPKDVLTAETTGRLDRARTSRETVVIRSADDVLHGAGRPAGTEPLTWHFKADKVRTFAWASSPAFIWDAAGTNGVLAQSLYPREGAPLWSKATDMLRFSIEHYSKTWFPYPYPVATNVNGIVGGMEYPMIIFCSERKDLRELYFVTTHEIGHNWFPMAVNTDERRHAWMDEGFNTFINWYSGLARFPDAPVADRFRGVEPGSHNSRDMARFLAQADQQPIETPADQIVEADLGLLQYWKVAVGLVCLREQILGPERFDAAFRDYISKWAFKSPQPADFFRCMENGAGCDLAWFWRGWFLETGALDQAVAAVEQDPDGVGIVFANLGELVMPLVYRLTWSDGTHETRRLPVEVWFNQNYWRVEPEAAGRKLVEVVIDPEGGFPDVNVENNKWVPKEKAKGKPKGS